MTRIGIVNTVSMNGGDAAILFAEIQALSSAWNGDCEFETFETEPLIAAKHNPWARFVHRVTSPYMRGGELPKGLRNSLRKRVQAWYLRKPDSPIAAWFANPRLRRFIENAPKYDLVIGAGGTILVEQHPLKDRFREMNFWLDRGVPMILYTQSMGPFKQSDNAREMRSIANRCLGIFVRDGRSLDNLVEIGVEPSKIELAPDAVFGLARTYSVVTPSVRNRPKIAISVRKWTRYRGGDAEKGVESYKDAIASAATYCVRKLNAEVVFVSTCQGIPEYWNDDSVTAAQIIERLAEDVREHASLDSRYYGPEGLIELLSGFDAVIATRMHMAIMSMCAGTPALAIAYEFKTTELYAGLGIPEWSLEIDGLAVESLISAIDRFWSEKDARMVPLRARINEQKAKALQVGVKVRQLLEEYKGAQHR